MGSKDIAVGADRFLALQWANYAYELFITSSDQEASRQQLRVYLESQMLGKESTRKSSNQLNRLWLYSGDQFENLREMANEFHQSISHTQMPVLHLGMAINVFPIYQETVRVIGTLEKITERISAKAINDRVIQKFPTTTSVPRIVNRVLQTLQDWGFIIITEGIVAVRVVPLQDPILVNWFILALLNATTKNEITLHELEISPLKLGINFAHPRSVINGSNELYFTRSQQGVEVVRLIDLARS